MGSMTSYLPRWVIYHVLKVKLAEIQTLFLEGKKKTKSDTAHGKCLFE